MAKDLAIVLCGAGVNSAVLAALAAQRCRAVMVYAEELALDGEKAPATPEALRRRGAFEQMAEVFKPFREHVVSIPGLPAARKSVAAAQRADPRLTATLDGQLQKKLLELLPLLSLAARLAGHYEAATVYLGLQVGLDAADDLARATEFLQIMTEMLQLPCGMKGLDIVAPLLELEPWQVVDLGVQIGAPLDKSWSCETGNAEPCGQCPGCKARDAAFDQAARMDTQKASKR